MRSTATTGRRCLTEKRGAPRRAPRNDPSSDTASSLASRRSPAPDRRAPFAPRPPAGTIRNTNCHSSKVWPGNSIWLGRAPRSRKPWCMEADCKNPAADQPRRRQIREMFWVRRLEPVFNDAPPPVVPITAADTEPMAVAACWRRPFAPAEFKPRPPAAAKIGAFPGRRQTAPPWRF